MFLIKLRFKGSASSTPSQIEGHREWLSAGFDDGVFLLAGSLDGAAGGAVLAHAVGREELDAIVARDPFVSEGIVTAEVTEFTPARTDERLAFLAT
ncbi:MAG: hypothetical protein QM648_03755 [Solirubrobacterales bacterium]